MIYQCKVEIIPYVITWEGIVIIYHKRYVEEIRISNHIQTYIQTKVLKKTIEAISFNYRRGIEESGSIDRIRK